MKKLTIILIAAVSFNAASAQSRNDNYKKRDRKKVTQATDNHNYNRQSRSNDYAYNSSGGRKDYAYNNSNNDKDYAYNNYYGKNDNRNRQEQFDQINRQYDQRINGYKKDHSMSARERERKINEAQQERQKSLAGFGTGVVAGGVVGFLLGVLVGH